MFSLGIRYLNGWAMAASDGSKKEVAEWPPHPGRVFMALAAAWFETGQDKQEGEALRWLESISVPPQIAASGAELRKTVISYVPINDVALAGKKKIDELKDNANTQLDDLKAAGLYLLAEYRLRQPRSFPIAIPHNPVVHLIWPVKIPDLHRLALIDLSRKVTSVGHSASLVQMWLEDRR
ncbi:type I-G CRISPR-associated protein Csb2 [Methylomicrobium sp. RS1]|uniref:type I-G CRISPR-associated protein Csb2 n=1 Tax=Candidatus Methylomicrobium oryzae TaxID=2802053 RepID=UPI0019244FA8|nr:type I-U CRISPR-associated protein Csb2 [Methylomicrobium sp. RS1]MBL1263960.1 type I-U CRISPR-associated protein Cas5/Cas6 [Methylomicrobium sp. RS1]